MKYIKPNFPQLNVTILDKYGKNVPKKITYLQWQLHSSEESTFRHILNIFDQLFLKLLVNFWQTLQIYMHKHEIELSLYLCFSLSLSLPLSLSIYIYVCVYIYIYSLGKNHWTFLFYDLMFFSSKFLCIKVQLRKPLPLFVPISAHHHIDWFFSGILLILFVWVLLGAISFSIEGSYFWWECFDFTFC